MNQPGNWRLDREGGLQEALLVARQHFQRGRLDEAAQLYRKVLELDPQNFDAFVGLGDLLMVRGAPGDALMVYGNAIRVRPQGSAQLFLNRGNALVAAADIAAANLSFQAAYELEPENVQVLNSLGSSLAELGRRDEALALFEKAARLDPANAQTHFNIALTLAAADPAKNEDRVVEAYRRAIDCDPGFAPALVNLAQILIRRRALEEALDLLEAAELQAPMDLPMMVTKAQIYEAMGAFGRALAHLETAALVHQDNPDVKTALAKAALACGKPKRALAACLQVLAQNPEHVGAKTIVALGLIEDGKFTQARDVLMEIPELPDAAMLLRHLDLADGRIDAWEHLAQRSAANPLSEGVPRWDGSQLAGPLLIDGRGEQPENLIPLARLLPQAAARTGRLVVASDPLFGPLLAGVPGVAELVVGSDQVPADLAAGLPFAALPATLGCRGRELPGVLPYLAPQAGRDRPWDPGAFVANEPVVAVCWRERGIGYGPDQDLTFMAMQALFEEVPARFLSLTYMSGKNDDGFMDDFGIIDIAGQCRDLEDVLTVVAQSDLIITCDGLLPHLAGAAGKECWLVLPVMPSWIWGRRGLKTPLYPSLRLYRAERTGDWSAPLSALRADLLERVA